MSDTFLNDLIGQLKSNDKARARREVLAKLAERLSEHDFAGEILDDRWCDHVSQESMRYLTEEEIEALEATTTEEEENTNSAVCCGDHVVLRAFVIWLCRSYDVKACDLEE